MAMPIVAGKTLSKMLALLDVYIAQDRNIYVKPALARCDHEKLLLIYH